MIHQDIVDEFIANLTPIPKKEFKPLLASRTKEEVAVANAVFDKWYGAATPQQVALVNVLFDKLLTLCPQDTYDTFRAIRWNADRSSEQDEAIAFHLHLVRIDKSRQLSEKLAAIVIRTF